MKVSCPSCSQPLEGARSVEEVTLEFTTFSLCARCGFGLDLRWRGRGVARARPVAQVVLASPVEGLGDALAPLLPVTLESVSAPLDALGVYARALRQGRAPDALLLTHVPPGLRWSDVVLSVRALEEGFGVTTPAVVCVVSSARLSPEEHAELKDLTRVYWLPCAAGAEGEGMLSAAPQLFAQG